MSNEVRAEDVGAVLAAAREVWLAIGLKRLEQCAAKFEEKFKLDYSGGGKIPRNTDLRPFRFAVQDVILFNAVVAHDEASDGLAVEVFTTAVIDAFEPDAAVKAGLIFLLCEAYRCRTRMGIQFSEYVEGGRVPEAVQLFCLRHRIPLSRINDGHITPEESARIFLAVTDFSPEMHAEIAALGDRGFLSTNRACYMVHHGVWKTPEMECILRATSLSDLVLDANAAPESRHLHRFILDQGRGALLGSALDRALASRDRDKGDGKTGFDAEDDDLDLAIGFEPDWYAKRYTCSDEPIPIPAWDSYIDPLIRSQPDLKDQPRLAGRTVPIGMRLVVLVRARAALDLRNAILSDIHFAGQRRAAGTAEEIVALLIPHDFCELSFDLQARAVAHANATGVAILVSPEPLMSIDDQVRRRFEQSRTLQ